jgi:hypothetical protein
MTYIANSFVILNILVFGFILIRAIILSLFYKDNSSKDLSGQSERQKRNNDYNNDYYP